MIGTSLLFSGSIAGLLAPGDIATPTAGYSLRPLSVSYSGAVVRVRRSGDDAEKDFNASELTSGQLSDFLNVFTESGHILNVYEDFKRRSVLTKPTTFYNFEDVSLVCNCIEESSGLIAYDALANMVSHQVAVYTDIDYPTIDDPSLVSPCNDGQADELNAFDDLLNLTTQNDGYVVTWYDQFGSNDATNSTAAEQPKIWDSTTGLLTENGRPAIEFDGSDDYLQASSLNISQPTMYFIVAKRDALTGKQNYIDGATTSQEIMIDSSNDTYDIEAGTGLTTTVVATTNQQVLVALFNGASSELFVNAVEIGLSGTPGTNAINNLIVGADSDQSDLLDGKMQEIIIYDADQSDRVLLQDNINTYFVLYGLKHYRQRVLADSGTFALEGRDALVYNSVTIPEMPSLICSCDAYKATKLYNINPA